MLTLPEKRLNADAEAVFATDRLPVQIPAKSPAQRRETRFPARLFPNPPRSSAPSSRTLRIPRSPRRFRACTASACLPGFCAPTRLSYPGPGSAFRCRFRIPTRLLHPGAPSLFRRRGHIPQHRSSAALQKASPTPTPCPARLRLFPGSRLIAPFVRFLKRKSPLERGPFS